MIDSRFVILAALFNMIGASIYAFKTFKGETQPNRVTWLLWAIVPIIAFFAELQEGVGIQSLMTFMIGFGPLIVFIASFLNRKAFWKISRLDIICAALSVTALVAWKLSGDADVAIFFSVLADALAGLPTLIKSWTDPDSEHYAPYLTSAFSAAITLATISQFTFAAWAFPAYILTTGLLVAGVIKFRPGKRLYGGSAAGQGIEQEDRDG